MKVVFRIILLSCLFVLMFNSTYSASFNVCGISFEEPWVEVKDGSDETVMLVDKDGDIYTRGEGDSSDDAFSKESLIVGEVHFNRDTTKFTKIRTEASDFDIEEVGESTFRVKRTTGEDLSVISSSGNIDVKGNSAIEGEQAACNPDGYYCSGNSRQYRDYYCDITGDRSGSCTYSASSTSSCSGSNGWTCKNSNTRAWASYGCNSGAPGSAQCVSPTYSSETYCDYGCSGSTCNDPPEPPQIDYSDLDIDMSALAGLFDETYSIEREDGSFAEITVNSFTGEASGSYTNQLGESFNINVDYDAGSGSMSGFLEGDEGVSFTGDIGGSGLGVNYNDHGYLGYGLLT